MSLAGLRDFVDTNQDAQARWVELKSQKNLPSIFSFEPVDELTPFFQTKVFASLTQQMKKELYVAFIQFNAEAIVFLELILFEGIKSLKNLSVDRDMVTACEKLLLEEKAHTRAYLRFLRRDCAAFPRQSYALRNNRWMKNSFLYLARKFPQSLALPAAKIEAYSIFYGKAFQKYFIDRDNLWTQINYLHLLDESHHVGFEFDMYEFEYQRQPVFLRLFSVLPTFFCIGYFQLCFIVGSYRIVKHVIKPKSSLDTLLWMLKLSKWILLHFEPYPQTRKYIQNQFQARKPKLGLFFRFMY